MKTVNPVKIWTTASTVNINQAIKVNTDNSFSTCILSRQLATAS